MSQLCSNLAEIKSWGNGEQEWRKCWWNQHALTFNWKLNLDEESYLYTYFLKLTESWSRSLQETTSLLHLPCKGRGKVCVHPTLSRCHLFWEYIGYVVNASMYSQGNRERLSIQGTTLVPLEIAGFQFYFKCKNLAPSDCIFHLDVC